MFRKQARALLALVAASTAGAAGSARADDEVLVHGSSAAGFSSRAGLDDASREVTDAASLIEPLPGIHVRRLGAEDSFATLSIRGSSSSEVVVVLAGVPLTGGADPSLDLSSLPLWPGARVRVYRTFAPAALGLGSLGGTLVLEPPRPSSAARTDVWDAVGSYGSARLRAGDVRQIADDGTRVMTALSASRANDAFTFYDSTHDALVTRANDGHADVNGIVSVWMPVRWQGGTEGALTVTTLAQARRQDLPGPFRRPTPFARLDSNRELSVVELTHGGDRGAWYARTWGRRDELRLQDKASVALGPSHTNDGIFAAGAAVGWRGRLAKDARLDVRADGTDERYTPGAYMPAALEPPGATRPSAGAGADLEWNVARWSTLAASGRVDGWSDRSAGSPARSEVRPTVHFGDETTLGPLALSAHAGAVARPPSFVELYGNRGGVIGDPNLKSESAWALDGGARVASRGPVRITAELVGFATWADDLIVLVPQGMYGTLQATNIGRARLFGAEAEVNARAFGFELRAAYTGLATFNDSVCDGVPNCSPAPLPGRPAHDFVGDLAYSFGPVRVRYGVDVISGIRLDKLGSIVVPARALHDAGLRLDVPGVPGLRVGVDVRNLFDLRVATYEGAIPNTVVKEPIGDLYDYPLPGRTVLVTARWTSTR